MPRLAIHTAALIAVLELIAFGATFADDLQVRPERSVPFGIIWAKLLYFTILTNALAGLAFAQAAWRGRSWGDGWLAALTLWMGIVAVVFHLLLADDRARTTLDWVANGLFHTICPALVAFWWATFAPKSRLKWRMAVIWLAWPGGYLLYAILRGMGSGVYPYFFVDLDRLGWAGLASWSMTLLAAFFVSGLAIVTLGKGLARVAVSR